MKSRLKQQIFAFFLLACTAISPANALYNRQIKKFPTEKQNVSLKHILT